MNQEELQEKIASGEIMKIGDYYFYANEVAKTLIGRVIRKVEVDEQ